MRKIMHIFVAFSEKLNFKTDKNYEEKKHFSSDWIDVLTENQNSRILKSISDQWSKLCFGFNTLHKTHFFDWYQKKICDILAVNIFYCMYNLWLRIIKTRSPDPLFFWKIVCLNGLEFGKWFLQTLQIWIF